MSLFFKILLIWFVFTACKPQEVEVKESNVSYGELNKRKAPSKWKSRDTFPLKLKYGNNFDSSEVDAISASAIAWDESSDNEIQFFTLSSSNIKDKTSLEAYDDEELGIYKLDQWPDKLPGSALAVTQIFGTRYNTGTSSEYILIDHADILLNNDVFTFGLDDEWGYDLETVVTHEMGHFLGLYHEQSAPEDSIMYPSVSKFSKIKDPTALDAKNILEKYPRRLQDQHSHVSKEKEKVKIILELYPSGLERFILQTKDQRQITTIKCSH